VKPRARLLLRFVAVALAAAALLPLLGVDPAVLSALLDVDFLLVTGTVGLTMLGTGGTVLASRTARSLPVLWVRVGVALSRSDPGTLVSP
jgi:hypothetical protein